MCDLRQVVKQRWRKELTEASDGGDVKERAEGDELWWWWWRGLRETGGGRGEEKVGGDK